MICLAAFMVLGILGVFSIRHRALAREAFQCVFLRVRFKPCHTGFDIKMKSKVTARLLRFPLLARIWMGHFQTISFMFTLVMLASTYFSVAAAYNIIRYGTCTPGQPCIIITFPAKLLAPFHLSPKEAEAFKTNKVEIDVFYDAKGCPNYSRVNDFFEQRIKPIYPVAIQQYEIHDAKNLDLARKMARAYQTDFEIPMMFVGDICIKGCSRVSLRKLEEAVRETIRNKAPAPSSRL